jgi:hypothetical protein
MASYTITSALSPSEVVDRARAFFGHDGLDLEVSVNSECCVRFADRGYVQVSVRQASRGTVVELETRLWDDQVREFVRALPGRAEQLNEEG